MSDNTCNGWANRETWVINLHYGDSEEWLQEMVAMSDGDIGKLADYLQEEISNQVEEIVGDNIFVSDLINLSSIDWWELASHYHDAWWVEEEEEEEEPLEYGLLSTPIEELDRQYKELEEGKE